MPTPRLLGLGVILWFDGGALACVVTATLLVEAARRGKLAVWLNLRPFLFVGMISYSLYLIHNPITGAFYQVAYKITGRGMAAQALWFLPMIGANIALALGFWGGCSNARAWPFATVCRWESRGIRNDRRPPFRRQVQIPIAERDSKAEPGGDPLLA